jgi:hypothetical protein
VLNLSSSWHIWPPIQKSLSPDTALFYSDLHLDCQSLGSRSEKAQRLELYSPKAGYAWCGLEPALEPFCSSECVYSFCRHFESSPIIDLLVFQKWAHFRKLTPKQKLSYSLFSRKFWKRYYIFESLGAWNEFLALHPVGQFFPPPLLPGTFLCGTIPSWVPDRSKACIAPAFPPEFEALAIPRDAATKSDCLPGCLVPNIKFRCKLHC